MRGPGDNVSPVVGVGPGICPEGQPVGLNLQVQERRGGRGNGEDKRRLKGETEDETRMSSLDACLLDLAVQGLGLPLVTTPRQGDEATEATSWSGGARIRRSLRGGGLLPNGGPWTRRGLAATALSLQ